MTRTLLVLAAFGTLFFFPYALSVCVVALTALLVPLAGIALGLMADALYFTPGAASFPVASAIGLVATVLSFAIHKFIRTHVMR